MTDRMRDDELATTLAALGNELAYPRPAEMASAVRARIAARPRAVAWWRRSAIAPALLTAVLLLLVVALGIPGVRAAAQEFFRIGGIEIFPVPSLSPRPSQPGGVVPPGDEVTLAEAQRRVDFTVRQPSGLGAPDAVYVDSTQHVSLVYRSALVVEFRATVDPAFFGKTIGPGTRLENATVNGAAAYWLEGAPHFFFYRTAAGEIAQETLRLAGNTLIWVEGGVTYRVEAPVSKDQAVAIASSLR